MVRFLHLPNEIEESDPRRRQVAPRSAFARLRDKGRIADFQTFSFLDIQRARGNAASKSELLAKAAACKPDIIFWQHVSGFAVDPAFVRRLRDVSGCKVLAYHDEDPFDRRVKRIDGSMRAILGLSDLALIGGTGSLFDLYRANGARNIRYLPHCYDEERFGAPWTPTREREHLISMIGNSVRRGRLRFLYVPGGAKRARMARALSERYAEDFALYGSGWHGLKAWRGVLPFEEQTKMIRASWISVNWDNFDTIPFYCSDRLPISLAAGVPHVTTYHDGYEYLLAGCPGVYTAKTVDEAISIVDWLLSRPKHELVAEGEGARAWVRKNWEACAVFERAFDMCLETMATAGSHAR